MIFTFFLIGNVGCIFALTSTRLLMNFDDCTIDVFDIFYGLRMNEIYFNTFVTWIIPYFYGV